VNSMCEFEDMNIISAYGRKQAVQDGLIVEIFKPRWKTMTAGKPIVATTHLANEVSPAGMLEIWNAYVHWRKHLEPFLPEEERLFHTSMNGKTVWVIEDGEAFTLMYPEDY
jgi:hypothetical protein